jgi:hypothetical protein
MKTAYKILLGESEWNRPFGCPWHIKEDSINLAVIGIENEVVGRI